MRRVVQIPEQQHCDKGQRRARVLGQALEGYYLRGCGVEGMGQKSIRSWPHHEGPGPRWRSVHSLEQGSDKASPLQ